MKNILILIASCLSCLHDREGLRWQLGDQQDIPYPWDRLLACHFLKNKENDRLEAYPTVKFHLPIALSAG